MNTHKNARLTYLRRFEMVQDITLRGLSAAEAAAAAGVSAVTARKWLGRFLVDGAQALLDKTSRPARSPRAIDPGVAVAIVELRRKLHLQAHIASAMGVSKATVSRVLRRAGLSRLSDLRPQEAVQRYEREAPGELLHIDIKKLGRFEGVGHRITGDYRKRNRHVGWEYVFVAVDDHSRVAFTDILPNERKESAVSFLRAAAAYYTSLGVKIQRVITDNGPAFHSGAFGQACIALGIAQKFTRAYRPQTNGKAERFIQSALREWAYGRSYNHSNQRQAALPVWTHFYNWHRQHHGIGCQPPISRLRRKRKNLLTLHTYAHYCTDRNNLAYGNVTWRVNDLSDTTDWRDWQIERDDRQGTVHFTARKRPMPQNSGTGPVAVTAGYLASLDPPDEPGDQTVPMRSADRQMRKGHCKAVFRQTGYDHQGSYQNETVLATTLYCILRIAQPVQVA